ncbi:hypothetical protein CFN78_22065 [Amycolatopsis antarctica]|uniref:Carrier domain-containing protein n=1 Tax=Amycolatopsis antarctica TaxID=1854586 RepID=A0A263D0U1_9PSEU|nr:non-ribosomal peptide synthetase [Amycolatopsis antarctica]OZM71146.1 hypothetical protein CFN78_22065 [Amycolatopsis antarctica]
MSVTVPADLPPPPVPGFVHDLHTHELSHPVLPDAGPCSAATTVAAVGAVLARYTGTTAVTLLAGLDAAGEPAALLLDLPDSACLGDLAMGAARAATGSAAAARVAVFTGPAAARDGMRARAEALVELDIVLVLNTTGTAWTLDCRYDPEKYLPATVHALAEDIDGVLYVLATAPGTRLSELPIAPRTAPEPRHVPSAALTVEPPRGRSETLVAQTWTEVLGETGIGREDNFFALGGHSLAAIAVSGRLRERFGVELPVDLLFGTPTVRAAAEAVDRLRAGNKRVALPPPVPRGTPPAAAPVSFSQERIWFFEQWSPGTAAYNQPYALDIEGALDPAALETALRTVLSRHDVLRTTFTVTDGLPVPVCGPTGGVRLGRHEVSAAGDRRAAAADLVADLAREPFDLASGPLLRADLVRLGTEEHVLLLTLHHLVNDGWSFDLVLGELARAYESAERGDTAPAPRPALQFADVAAWQRSATYRDALDEAVGHFEEALRGAPPALDLPADHPRPPVPSYAGGQVPFAVPDELAADLRRLAGAHGTTLFSVLLAAFQTLLHRLSGQDDFLVGITCANRDQRVLEDVPGPMFNMVAVRADLARDLRFTDLLDQARQRALGAFARQEVPFELLVERLAPRRDPSRSPLFQVLLELEEPVGARAPEGLVWTGRPVGTGTSKLDLTLTMTGAADSLTGLFTYSTDLFDRATVRGMAGSLLLVLETVCADPDLRVSEVDIRTEKDRALQAEVNRTARAYPDTACLHELFQEQVARTPDATAVRDSSSALTFRELDERSNALAWRLRGLGAGAETLVGLCLERSAGMLVGMLGILKAGAAYVPIEPGYPDERKRLLAADLALVAGHRATLGWHEGVTLPLDDPRDTAPDATTCPPPVAGPGNLAYVIYTSGSTGRPKGVLVEHRGLVNFVEWCVRSYVGEATGGAPVFSSFAFDMLVPNLFAPLLCGQAVHLLPADLSPAELGEALGAHAPYAFIKLTPGHLDLLAGQLGAAEAGALCSTLVVGADAFSARTLAAWRALDPHTPVLNEYGPTEASVANSVLRVERAPEGELLPIGRPIDNTTMYVLDAGLRPVPAGTPGELFIGGGCVVRGYSGRASLTAERFLPDPFAGSAGARMYRTGDRGRLRGDGAFEFLGRLDDQVKIDGYRIEPGEIEAALASCPGVDRAVVVPRADATGTNRLLGWIAAAPGVDADAVRAVVAERLPRHLVPHAVVRVDAIPLNANGKVDRAALPDPIPRRAAAETALSELEEILRHLWGEVLARPAETIGIGEDFFGLGGRSLDAVRLMSRTRELLRTAVPTVALFHGPTVAALALAIVAHEREPGISARMARAALRLRRLSPAERAELARRHRANAEAAPMPDAVPAQA